MTFLSVAELAAISGRHEKTIRRALTSGRLAGDVDETTGQWLIPTEAAYKLYPPRKGVDPVEPEASDPAEDYGPIMPAAPTNGASWMERAIRAETQLDLVRIMLGQNMDAALVLASLNLMAMHS